MKQVSTIDSYDQLKAISDPLRAKMMMRLIEKPFTGQQLAELLDLSRAKIHYHLKELAKNGLIKVVKTEEKNGIVQKFYRAVATGFVPSPDLMPHVEEVSEATKAMLLQMMDRSRTRLLTAPDMAFQSKDTTDDYSEWPYLSTIYEITITEGNFKKFIKKFHQLMEELREEHKSAEKDPNGKLYHITAYGFQVDEPLFEQFDDKKESK
ncbi:ArsR/SmtB family transcription factor [Oceanobacillus halophilus]|uniref:ArsR family transcriptional regulator n=1 Tax=Oceanobacillus halophilus TaxID=930130 RepID=A0A495A4M0_9BACI|nr:winged helix-turn-helix domain-containing protein [Oceanobacillus halophilus]RKQ34598.1 ArsR family transcriptional regulator [Oceanobacillus halophilus]